MKEVHYRIIPEDLSGQRIDNFLITALKGVPKTHIYKILRSGEVRVNGGRIKQTYRLQEGDKVRIPPMRLGVGPDSGLESAREAQQGLRREAAASLSKKSADFLLSRILYEDEGFLILNKPGAWAVHGGSGVSLGIIESLRLCHPAGEKLELVHRLDRDTSGCLMVTKKRSSLKILHEALKNHDHKAGNKGVQKYYWALVQGQWLPENSKNKPMLIDAPLQKNQLQSGERMVRVSYGQEAQAALTKFRVLGVSESATWVEAQPITGRTHQIRVHAQHAGHPIAGDEKYGDKNFNQALSKQQGLKRLFLHASRLELQLPEREEPLIIHAALDADLAEVLVKLGFEYPNAH
ncbi:MAG: RluA family pseudouridine synthase [Gammaproteobacteria bacterium]